MRLQGQLGWVVGWNAYGEYRNTDSIHKYADLCDDDEDFFYTYYYVNGVKSLLSVLLVADLRILKRNLQIN